MGCLKLSYYEQESALEVNPIFFGGALEKKGNSDFFCLKAYTYGFNGKEKDQQGEWGLTAYDYGFRIYNPALGRFLSVDPLTKSYPMLTPYQFASNTPIRAIDLDGLEAGYTSSYGVYVNEHGDYTIKELHGPVLQTDKGDWSGIKINYNYFHEGELYRFLGDVPGYREWKREKDAESLNAVMTIGGGAVAIALAVPTGGSSLVLASVTGGATIGLGSYKLYQTEDGRAREFKNLPLGLGEAAGGLIGKQLGDEELGKQIGGFGESLIGAKDITKLPSAFKNKKGLDILTGLKSLYDVGSDGYKTYETIINKYFSETDEADADKD